MTPEQIVAFKNALVQATDTYIQQGGKIIRGQFGTDFDGSRSRAGDAFGGLCPISCLVGDYRGRGETLKTALTTVLGFEVSEPEYWDFIFAFDALLNDVRPEDARTPSYNLGRELAAKYLQG